MFEANFLKMPVSINVPKSPSDSTLNTFVCKLQGRLLNFLALAHETHKSLRLKIAHNAPAGEINAKFDYLEKILNHYLLKSLQDCERYLEGTSCMKKGYLKRRRISARLTIMAVRSLNNEYPSVLDLHRDDMNIVYGSTGTPTKGNTGFEQVWETRKAYLCNNIPKEASRRAYTNPRLNPDTIAKHTHGSGLRKLEKNDDLWESCWTGYRQDETAKPKSCYRSTLIVPISLAPWQIDHELRDYLSQKASLEGSPIFGFVCFDHVRINFFSEEDKQIALIVADLFSLLLFSRHMLTTWSETYNSVASAIPLTEDKLVSLRGEGGQKIGDSHE